MRLALYVVLDTWIVVVVIWMVALVMVYANGELTGVGRECKAREKASEVERRAP